MKSDQNHVDKRILEGTGLRYLYRGKGFAVRQVNKHNSCPASVCTHAFIQYTVYQVFLTGARQVCIKTMKPLILTDGWMVEERRTEITYRYLLIPIADPKIVTVIPMLNHTHILIPPNMSVKDQNLPEKNEK